MPNSRQTSVMASHPEAERQSEGAPPLPNSLSTASTPPAEQKQNV
jgi:hypothetical protein